MPYAFNYNSTSRIIELVHSGNLSGEDLRKSTDEGILLQKEHGAYAVLIDATDLESVATVTGVYDLPRQYDEGGFKKETRIALVWPRLPAAKEAAQFYDNVCSNRGWTVQPFDTRDEAVAWLMSNESS